MDLFVEFIRFASNDLVADHLYATDLNHFRLGLGVFMANVDS